MDFSLHLKFRFKIFLAKLGLLLFFVTPTTYADVSVNAKPGKGSISGTVIDQVTREPLPFASVKIKGQGYSTVSDNNGSFYFGDINVGTVTIQVTYLGYGTLEKAIAVQEEKITTVEISLVSDTRELDGITITGIRRGEVKALSDMRTADNMKYVLSQEQIERFPDATVGEALQRVPGLAMDFSYGLPKNVIIRGLDQSMGSVTMNGARLPSTETKSRTMDLNGILSATVESIEVNKTLTPDMDADGTAGSINIITKTPVKGMEFMEAKGSYSRNGLLNNDGMEGGVTYGKRDDKWGYLMGVNYSNTIRGEDRVQQDYDEYEINGTEQVKLSNLDLEGSVLHRKNWGVQTEVSYFHTEQSRVYFRGAYNKYFELQTRGQRNYSIDEYAADGAASGVSIGTSGTPRDYDRNLLTLALGTRQVFNNWVMDGELSYSKGLYDQPVHYDAYFTLSGQNAMIDQSDRDAPQFNFEGNAVNDPASFTTNYYSNRHQFANDQDLLFRYNAVRGFRLAGEHKGSFKFGGKYGHKSNDHARNFYQHLLKDGSLNLGDFLSSYSRDNFFDGRYDLSNTIANGYLMEKYYQQNTGLFEDNTTANRQDTDPDGYSGTEDLGAAYVMGKLNVNKFEFITGLRYENTSFDYKGNVVSFDETGKYVSTNPVNTKSTFDGFFPSLNLKYSLDSRTNFRAAITRSLSRPSYYDLVPWEEVEVRRKRIKKGNSDLNQATSMNLDFLFEHYLKSVGLVAGGVFYKEIDNYIYEGSYIQEGGKYDQWKIEQSVNGAAAKVYGFELTWQQQLTFLPGVLNGLGIYANYTYIQSEFTVPGLESTRTVRLPGMRPRVGNVSLSYEKFGFSGRLSMNFYDTFTDELAETPDEDILEVGRKQIDFSASQKVTKQIKIFMGISNINNAQMKLRFGDGRPTDHKFYSVWGNLGIKYSPFK